MPVRLLLILTFLIQPLSLTATAGRVMSADCRATSCCQVIETTTCCGEKVLEQYCSMSGGECRCGVQEDTTPTPTPVAPPTPDRNDLTSQLFAAGSAVTAITPPAVRTPSVVTRPAPHRTHHETQALLCIWRT